LKKSKLIWGFYGESWGKPHLIWRDGFGKVADVVDFIRIFFSQKSEDIFLLLWMDAMYLRCKAAGNCKPARWTSSNVYFSCND